MFRPTHFVILFAVVLYANAFPAAPSAPLPRGPIQGPQPGLPVKQPVAGAPGQHKRETPKDDLATDATEYWGFNDYYGTRWATYEPDVWFARTHGWPVYYY